MLTAIRTEQNALISQERPSSQISREQGRSFVRSEDQLSFSQEARQELAAKQAAVTVSPTATSSQSSENFVSIASPSSSQEQAKTISWAHGTYHAGRLLRAATGPANFGTSGTADLSLAREQQQSFAAHSYSRMSRQGVMPTSLAPNGTGISLSV